MSERARPPVVKNYEHLMVTEGGPTFEQAIRLIRRMATCEMAMLAVAIERERSMGRSESRRPVTLQTLYDLTSPEIATVRQDPTP